MTQPTFFAPLFKTAVDSNFEGLGKLLAAAKEPTVCTYLNALYESKLDTTTVESLNIQVQHACSTLDMECDALYRCSRSYNDDYRNNKKGILDQISKMLKAIKRALKPYLNIFNLFRHRWLRPRKSIQPAPENTIFDRSELNAKRHSEMMFGMEIYRKVVSELYDTISHFFRSLVVSLNLCKMTLNEEKEICQSTERSMRIYQKSLAEELEIIEQQLQFATLDPNKLTLDPIYNAVDSGAMTFDQAVAAFYHQMNDMEFLNHAYHYKLRQDKREDFMPYERELFDDDLKRAKKVRWVINHLDELKPKLHGEKIHGTVIAALMLWAGIGLSDGKETTFFKYFCEQYKGEHKLPKNVNTVNTAKNTSEHQVVFAEWGKKFDMKAAVMPKQQHNEYKTASGF